MALESKKIPSFDSEPKTTSNYMLRFFSKKIDLPTLFSFYQYVFLYTDFYPKNQLLFSSDKLLILLSFKRDFWPRVTSYELKGIVLVKSKSRAPFWYNISIVSTNFELKPVWPKMTPRDLNRFTYQFALSFIQIGLFGD